MDPEDLRAWVASRRAAAERERQELRDKGPDPEFAIRSALDLLALTEELHGWPVPEDEVTRREDLQMWENWARVRAKLGGR
jgi:hypothetical protein